MQGSIVIPVGLHSGMRALMPGELVGPGEPPPAARPGAREGLLAGVAPRVGLQVARLGVHLAAAREQTGEDLVVVFDVSLRRRVLSAVAKKRAWVIT